jgi:cofilin
MSAISTGISVNSKCIELYYDLKINKKYNYLIYGISKDNNEILPLDYGNSKYEELLEKVNNYYNCCYIIYNLKYDEEGDMNVARKNINKIIFIHWIPTSSSLRNRMLIAASKSNFRNSLEGIHLDIYATDLSDICLDNILDKI